MKKYVVLNKDELTDEMLTYAVPATIYTNTEEDSGFRIIAIKEGSPEIFQEYLKLTKEGVKQVREDIENGLNVTTKVTKVLTVSAFSYAEDKRARFVGAICVSNNAGETNSDEYTFDEDRILTGARYHVWGGNFRDSVTFEVLDKGYIFAGVLYPETPALAGVEVPENYTWAMVMPDGVPIDSFANNWYVKEGSHVLEAYPARIRTGMTIRLTYNNVGSESSDIAVNLLLHKMEN